MIMQKPYRVVQSKRIQKAVAKLPWKVRALFKALTMDIEKKGPIQKDWSNFSELGKNEYHCHLNYHYVACWHYDKKINAYVVEVNYVGSRENAPY